MFFNSFNVMAKSKSFFGLRTGSTKSLTFQVLRGQQITKDRVYRVSNPRSEAQMTQRALIPIVAAARSQLKGLVDHSFEGVAYGEASLREFSAQNLRAGALEVTSFSPNGVSNAGFANLLVSKGSINGNFQVNHTSVTDTRYETLGKYPKFAFPAANAGDNATGLFNYLAEFGSDNNVPIFKPGTQLTFLTIYDADIAKVNTGTGITEASLSGFVIDRFMIPNAETGDSQPVDVNGDWKIKETITQNAEAASIVNGVGDVVSFGFMGAGGETQKLFVSVAPKITEDGQNNCGGALILSRYENGTWKRSTERINIGYEPANKYTFEDWLSVYKTTGSASKKYLNNGNEDTGIQG